MKKRVVALFATPILLFGALCWVAATARSRAENSMRQYIPLLADYSGHPNRGMAVRGKTVKGKTADFDYFFKAQPEFETILTPQEVRILARGIRLQEKPRDEFALEDGRIDDLGITIWFVPDRRANKAASKQRIAVRLEWGWAIEGDRTIRSWGRFELTPDSCRALQRTLWKQRAAQLKPYVSAPK